MATPTTICESTVFPVNENENIEEDEEKMSERDPNNKMANQILLLSLLNDYCFLEIFKYLSLHALANFKETYKSLGAMVDIEFFRKTRGSLHLCLNDTLDEPIQIIKQFGPSLNSLHIRSSRSDEMKWCDIFAAIGKHCNEKLKSLSIRGEATEFITNVDVLLIADILKNIETIDIGVHFRNDLFDIFSHCKNARSITSFSTIRIDLNETIFQENRNLLKLQLGGWINDSDLKTIVHNLSNTRLQELLIMIRNSTSSAENLSQLLRLSYLKRLSILSCPGDISPFLQSVGSALNLLNVLSLWCIDLNQTVVAALRRMTQLKVLKLKNCFPDTNSHFASLLALCENKNLEHLIFMIISIEFNSIDNAMFRRIIEKRKAAENCFHLTVPRKIYTKSLKVIPYKLLEANKEVVELIDQCDPNYEYWNIH